METITSLKRKALEILPMNPKNLGGNEMKPFANLFATFVLTAAMLTGCGCTNQNAGVTSAPTMMPTTETTSIPTTVPTEASSTPSTDETINHGNGPLEDNTTTATENTVEGRTRQGTGGNFG